MTSSQPSEVVLTIGVDTHAEAHVAVALDQLGRRLGTCTLPTTEAGYADFLRWASQLGTVHTIGMEGTGSYGAGLSRWLRARGLTVVEVERPKRQARYGRGKSDPIDAELAARAVQAGTALGQPKAGSGMVEMIRALSVARRSALKARTQAANQLRALLVTAPEPVRHQLRRMGLAQLVRSAAAFRPTTPLPSPLAATKLALKSMAVRHQQLSAEIEALDRHLAILVAEAAPALLTAKGMGTHTAAALLLAAGDNPERLRTEAAFAHLCGVAPIPASSGKTNRHRLNRGGNRAANWALYLLALGRMGWHEPTRAYVARRTAEGLSKPEIIRCLKRFIAREVYRLLVASTASPPRSTGQPAPSSALVTMDGSLCEPSRASPIRGAAVTRRGAAQRSRPRSGLASRAGRSPDLVASLPAEAT
jgi:transposase